MHKKRSQKFELYLFGRVLVATLVIGSTAIAQFIAQEVLNINPLNAVVVFTLGYTLLSAFIYLFIGYSDILMGAQYLADILTITVLVYLTGAYNSPLSMLYLVFIVVCAFLVSRRALFRLASVAVIVYGLLVMSVTFGWLNPYPSEWFPASVGDYRPAFFSLIYMLFGMAIVAFLVSVPLEHARLSQRAIQHEQVKVRSLQTMMQFLVTHLPNPFYLTDEKGHVIFANDEGHRLLKRLSRKGENAYPNLIEWFELPVSADEMKRRLSWNFIVQDPEERSYDVRVYHLDAVGDAYQWLWLFQDVTEDLKRQEQLRLKDRMSSLREMAAGLAHEIKNPLAAIHTSVQLLQRKGNVDNRELLSILERETRRLRDVVDQFMQIAQPDQLKVERVSVSTLIHDVVHLVRMTPNFHDNHDIRVEVIPGNLFVEVDPSRFKQVIWNLLTNALKVMPEGGKVSIEAVLDGQWVRFRVRDNGPGIPREKMKNLFQPFQQSTTGGLGLGLAIVYNIIQAHGGFLQVQSEPEKGTVFEFWVPSYQDNT